MNTMETHAIHETHLTGSYTGGLMTERIGAVAAIILAILGLAGILSRDLAAIATIVIGAIMLADGGLARQARRRLAGTGSMPVAELSNSGVTAEFFGGFAGIVLGILAMFQPAPQTLLAVAVLVFGAALLLGGGLAAPLTWLIQSQNDPYAPEAQTPAFAAPSSGHTLVGLAALVLGILAVVGLAPLTLVLVGLLALGASGLFAGSALLSGYRQ